jgi:hypothetical protein
MRPCTGLARAEFALLAGPRATSRAADSLYPFESRLLGLHGGLGCGNPKKKNGQFCSVKLVVETSPFQKRRVAFLEIPTPQHDISGRNGFVRDALSLLPALALGSAPSSGVLQNVLTRRVSLLTLLTVCWSAIVFRHVYLGTGRIM